MLLHFDINPKKGTFKYSFTPSLGRLSKDYYTQVGGGGHPGQKNYTGTQLLKMKNEKNEKKNTKKIKQTLTHACIL